MYLYKFAFVKVYTFIKLFGTSDSNSGAITFSVLMATVYINLLTICNAIQLLMGTNKFIGYVDFTCLMLLFAIDYKYSLHTLTWNVPAPDKTSTQNNSLTGYLIVLFYITLSAWLLIITRGLLAAL
ncbi:hypothetical protein FPZ43_09230 [Mucilaginibacter pallidiroseus]|uniref:Uncharacterized protein n=1 Tax=Mucilaginibacter pallidiroseus TaxID=2599295 RepID=A0A563UF85_9SPHI|nr:hypothetical protein [Mucilaginibacter pallidiroseus]TWR30018.1 hypothetical protein FPZ43_09230 [Mucilaginibacter pallidiroseus]